ncbi:MAG: cellulase family glycosylhydrolase [Candidatus Dormibacteraeota bacterium]|nr:cellulase family glycosylhydrolase [Candidatus Dormibacteraeota bacterium]
MNARRFAQATAAVVVFLVAVFTYPGAVATSVVIGLMPAPSAPPAPPGVLPWLHVEHPSLGQPYIADDHGRMVLLHGAIPQGLIDFYSGADPSRIDPPPYYPVDPAAYDGTCPENSSTMPAPPLCQSDLGQMAAFGFNSLRLPLSWSLLEPERGKFNRLYVDRVAQVVGWARAARMYVIIDMHQNAYSRFVGRVSSPPWPGGKVVDLRYYTGAPAWATITDGFPPEQYGGQRELNPAGLEANSNFWYDRIGIQDEYIAAIAVLAKRFKDDSTVVGYSPFNEPFPGWNLPPGFEDLLLFPFYRRVIDAISGVRNGLPCWTGFFMPSVCGYRDLGVHDLHHLFFLEAGLLREVTDFPTHLGLPVSSYPNLVLSLHAYTHQYTIDHLLNHNQNPDQATYPWGGYDQSYALGEREAKAMKAAIFVSEFGFPPGDVGARVIGSQLLEMERHRVGFAFWTWKENGGGNWSMFDGAKPNLSPEPSSGCLKVALERLLARVYPLTSADSNLTYGYNTDTGAFELNAQGRSGDAPTQVYIPREVIGKVTSGGRLTNETVDSRADGSRLVTASPSGGSFSISVAAAPLALTGCP